MSYKYAIIPLSQVDDSTVKYSYKALAFARKDLQLPYVHVKWFKRIEYVDNPVETFEDESDLNGLVRAKFKDTIFINASLPTEEALRNTIFHECFHIKQLRGPFGFTDTAEYYADAYTADALKRYVFDENDYYDEILGKDWSITFEEPKKEAVKEPAHTEEYERILSGIKSPGMIYKRRTTRQY